jgi:chromosome segregation ATPase
MASSSPENDIETLKKRHKELDTLRTKARANLENAQKQLDELKTEARTAYGTDDLEQLRVKLAEMKKENEEKRSAYEQHLDEIAARLVEVEKAFNGSNTGAPRAE